MFKYKKEKQWSIFDFHPAFESHLNLNNCWVKIANMLGWDKLSEVYRQILSSTTRAGNIDARVIVRALIIKFLEKKNDSGTFEIIREHPYIQYFLGLDYFSDKPFFDLSLFVTIRKQWDNNKVFDKLFFQVLILWGLQYWETFQKLYRQQGEIYRTKTNSNTRIYLKEQGIRYIGRPLGRKPKKEPLNHYQRQKQKKEKAERNQVEGKFGQDKNNYEVNKIKVQPASAYEGWVTNIVLVMNIL